jgi:plasmid stabilization system protein ParE
VWPPIHRWAKRRSGPARVVSSLAWIGGQLLGKILSEFDLLESTPKGFALAPEKILFPYDLHQIIVKPYRILYRVTGNCVEIIQIRHGARLPATLEEIE